MSMILCKRQMTPYVALVMATLVAMTTVSSGHPNILDKLKELFNDQERARDMELEMDSIRDPEHGVRMGVPTDFCDNGINQIDIDWDRNSNEQTGCFNDDYIQRDGPAITIEEDVPGESIHVCYPKQIHYESDLPLSGPHRPLWPVFGEYVFLPPQRWVHTLEHGAIVFLYHPCEADTAATHDIKTLLNGCLWKRAISPYRKIPYNMPYALLAFQHALLFSSFDKDNEEDIDKVMSFIEQYAFEAPETGELKNGQYSAGLKYTEDKYIMSEENVLKC